MGNVSWLLALALLGITTKRTALTAALIVPLTLLFWAVAWTLIGAILTSVCLEATDASDTYLLPQPGEYA